MDIRHQIYPRTALWSGTGGRDYIRVGDEVFSINGLYCDEKGTIDRWGTHVTVIDIRWPVVERSSYDGVLRFRGDLHDLQALDHYEYSWPAMHQPKGHTSRMPYGLAESVVTPKGAK